ncbi:MAG: non-canonical purine NTP pyrophosphatase [Rubrobacter sp.]|nr:non-canonical purine NTP pyrophosphatase [Rubrobacter sp.]
MKALFVTSNDYKRREAARILGVELEAASPDLPEIQALDVEVVAAAKALAAREALGRPARPVLVEDSGIVVGAWNGLPGALTKWFISSVGIEGLLSMLPPGMDRSAVAVCAVAVAASDGSVEIFHGEVRGRLAERAMGESGFGWDPIFIPEGSDLTYAALGDKKSEDSHRTRAFLAARERLGRR